METQKNLGIWMDHSNANLVDLYSKKTNILSHQNLLSIQKKKH